jgi:citrate lyase subunit beta/citryl-CoA lyase
MTKTFKAGIAGKKTGSDAGVEYTPGPAPLVIEIESKVKSLYGDALYRCASEVCRRLGLESGVLTVQDFGALPFVIMAKIEAVIKQAHPDITTECLPELQAHCLYPTRRERFRRSRLYLPGNQPKLMVNAGIHQPDAVILDLEDAVAQNEKVTARYVVRNALRVLDFFGAERIVRINRDESGLADLECTVPHNVHAIIIPKVEDASQVRGVEDHIEAIRNRCGRREPVYLIPLIESARGVVKCFEIAEASVNNVALAIGLEDYTADIGAQRTQAGEESIYARSAVINAAKATGLQALDSVFSDVADEAGLAASVHLAKDLGFNGKGCIHPRQIRVIHEGFSPDENEINTAKAILLAFDEAQTRGSGVTSRAGKMIDAPLVKRAHRTIELAISSNLLARDWKDGLVQQTR